MGKYNFGSGGPYFNGMPLVSGLPVTFGNTAGQGAGKYYFVNPTTGADGNQGLSMDKPLATVLAAYNKTTSNNHDVVVLSATAAHAQTLMLSVTNNRVHFWGLDAVGRYYGQRSRITSSGASTSGIALVQTTGVGTSFSNIKFDSGFTLDASLYTFADGGEYTRMQNCEIYKSSDLDEAGAAELLMNGDSSYYSGCTIGSLDKEVSDARTNVLLTGGTITGKVCRDVMFENCRFWLKSSSATASHFHATTATDVVRMLQIKNSEMIVAKLSSGTVGDAIIIDAALTEGQILVNNTCNLNSTALSTNTLAGVLYYGPEIATAGTAGNPVAVVD